MLFRSIVTSGHQVIPEKVISQRPSLVLVDSNTGPKSAIDLIRASKIKVISVSEAWNLRDIYTKVDQVASAIGLKQQSKILITQMKEFLANMTHAKMLETDALAAENLNKQLRYIPMPLGKSITIG